MKVGDKPIISYIIESYPKEVRFVVTLGHFGNYVKDFLKIAYPGRKFLFVWVDKYEGEGSSLVYSMLEASKKLMCPFIYHASDTLVSEAIPEPEFNWCGGLKGNGSSNYASYNVVNGKVQQFSPKGAIDSDFLAVGLVGIKDYESFWDNAREMYKKNIKNQSLSDIAVLNQQILRGKIFESKEFTTWVDTGNVEGLNNAKKQMPPTYPVLEKPTEAIFFIDGYVVKFFSDESIVSHRVERTNYIKGIVPKIVERRGNFYKYSMVPGVCYAQVANRTNLKRFLKWSKRKLWKPVKELRKKDFFNVCYDFYYNKTQKRIAEFLSTRLVVDQTCFINGVKVPTAKELLAMVDFNWLCKSKQTTYHGDFILDNVIKTKKGFCLIDWRQDFGGLLKAGDMYYDLAKLNHNLILNHDVINENHFIIKFKISSKTKKTLIFCDTLRPQRLVECQEYLYAFVKKNKLDLDRIKILTAISWLNMCPLHEHPYDIFLFYFGKYNLLKAINEHKKKNS